MIYLDKYSPAILPKFFYLEVIMIKLLVKILAIATVSLLTACGATLHMDGGAQQRQAQMVRGGYVQPAPQQVQQQNGGCAQGSHRVGTNANGGAHCQWNSPQQAQPQPQPRQHQQQQRNCNGAGYRDLTTGRFISAC